MGNMAMPIQFSTLKLSTLDQICIVTNKLDLTLASYHYANKSFITVPLYTKETGLLSSVSSLVLGSIPIWL